MTEHVVETTIERPDEETVQALTDVPTAVLCDVTTKYTTAMDHEIKPVAGESSFVGTALTVAVQPGDNLFVHRALKLAEPGDVIVIDADGYCEAGVWGDLISTSAAAHDLSGTVIDGAARDTDDVDDLGYPVFARAVSPKGSYKSSPGSINVPVSCGGVTVEPGAVVVGDAEGVVVVDPDRAAEVAAAAVEKLDAEAETRRRVEAGEYIFDFAELDEQYDALDVPER